MKQQPEFGLSEVYLGNHLALLPEPKLGKVKILLKSPNTAKHRVKI